MLIPILKSDATLNAHAAKIERMENEIQAWDSIIHVTQNATTATGLGATVAKVQLDALQEFLGTRQQDLLALKRRIKILLREKREEIAHTYYNSLVQREAIFENGQEIRLTPQVINARMEQLMRDLKAGMRPFKHELVIDEELNLGAAVQHLEEKYQVRRIVISHFESEQERLSQQYTLLRPILRDLQQRRNELMRDDVIQDIFTASALGAVDFIGQQFTSQPVLDRLFATSLAKTRDSLGFTALHVAAFFNRCNVVSYLLTKGAEVTARSKYDVEDPGFNGYTPLHFAVKAGAGSVVATLIQHHAPINGRGHYDRTPLHIAAFNGHDECAMLLLSRGANPNLQTNQQAFSLTPLHEAVIHGNERMVRVLLHDDSRDLKTDVMIPDVNDHTVLWHAVADGLPRIVRLLTEHHSFTLNLDLKDPSSMPNLKRLKPRLQEERIRYILDQIYPEDPDVVE